MAAPLYCCFGLFLFLFGVNGLLDDLHSLLHPSLIGFPNVLVVVLLGLLQLLRLRFGIGIGRKKAGQILDVAAHAFLALVGLAAATLAAAAAAASQNPAVAAPSVGVADGVVIRCGCGVVCMLCDVVRLAAVVLLDVVVVVVVVVIFVVVSIFLFHFLAILVLLVANVANVKHVVGAVVHVTHHRPVVGCHVELLIENNNKGRRRSQAGREETDRMMHFAASVALSILRL